MKRIKHLKKLSSVILCIAIISACSNTNNVSISKVNVQNEDDTSTNEIVLADMPEKLTYDDDDIATAWTTESSTTIQLNGTDASINGTGAEALDGSVTITAAGTYVLSGKLDDGAIVVDVSKKDKVHLIMNGVELHNSNNAPINIIEADKVIITLLEGTQNIVTDGATYTYADATADEPDAAIFSKADLTVNGTGTLVVNGNYKDGLKSKDDLIIMSGTIEIHASDDGLVGRDLVGIKDGTLTIQAGGDGIKTTNDEEASKGSIVIEGGTFNVVASGDGLQSAMSVRVDGGAFDIISGGGSINGEVRSEGAWGGRPNETTQQSASTDTEVPSMKAVKASSHIMISTGTFIIDSADDSLHSNGSIVISGGELKMSSGDDGIHVDTSITIEGGIISIAQSYEGIESEHVTITDGNIHVVSKDDGINISGGNDGSSINGRAGQNGFTTSNDGLLTITGGEVTIDAEGDGLDSNGSIEMSGGTVIVFGPTASGNGSLDYDGTFDMSGGILVAAGSAGMVSAPSVDSSQYTTIMNYSETKKAGTSVSLEDANDNIIATISPTKNYQTIIISSPELKEGSTYTYNSADNIQVDFEIVDSVTWLNESGVTEAGTGSRGPGMGMGGMQRPGGDRPRPEGDIQRPEGNMPRPTQ